MRRQKQIMRIILWFGFFVLIVFLASVSYSKIFHPAYFSVVNSCGILSEDELNDEGFYITGAVSRNRTGNGTTIVVEFIDDTRTIRHEICHLHQIRDNDLNSCDNMRALYFDEVECYIKQYLPIYNEEIEYYRGVAYEDN